MFEKKNVSFEISVMKAFTVVENEELSAVSTDIAVKGVECFILIQYYTGYSCVTRAFHSCPCIQAHISEIFSTWGQVKSVEMPSDHMHPEFHRGFAYIDFTSSQAASDAVNYMNGGQIDGQEVNVTEVLPPPPAQHTASRSGRQLSPLGSRDTRRRHHQASPDASP